MFLNRIIPTLLLDENRLIKTRKFRDPIYIGDPINVVQIFNKKEVNELILLNISLNRFVKNLNFDLLKDITSECFVPISYGGGIRSLEQIEKLLYIGFEKIIINTFAVLNPKLIIDAIREFGSSTIIGSIDYRIQNGKRKVFIQNGRKDSNLLIEEIFSMYINMGVGEIMITSIDNDGCFCGYDLDVIKILSEKSEIPLIINGGASSLNDMKLAVNLGAQAVAAGSLFTLRLPYRAVLISYPSESLINKVFKNGI